jgi:hypothetical protein
MNVAAAAAALALAAAALHDWTPGRMEAPPGRVALAADENAGPERLRLDLLDAVRGAGSAAGRNLFRYVEAPPVRPPARSAASSGSDHPLAGDLRTQINEPPHAEAFPLMFYGYARHRSGATRALFYEGENIYLASEGEVIGARYRILRIGAMKAEIEDLVSHRRHTLALEPDAVPS